MTIETQARDVMLRAADQIDVEPPPIDLLLGAAARRRRRMAGVVAGLSAAAVVVAVAIVSSGGSDSGTPATTDPTPPTAAPGTRLVGVNGVMLSVPQDWATDRVRCGTPMADTVYFDTGGVRSCLVRHTPSVSVLRISDVGAIGSEFQQAQDVTEPTTIDGVHALRWPTRHLAPACSNASPDGEPLHCTAKYVGTLYLPDLGVVFSVSSPHPGVVDPILDSAHLIPDGYVAIPLNTTGSGLEALGLDVDVPDGIGRDRVLPTDPDVGSVVALGSTVSMVDTRVPACCIGVQLHIGRPRVECGPTGGAMVTVLASRGPTADVVLELVDKGHVVGRSAPTILSRAVATRLSAVVTKPTDGSVDLYVRRAKAVDPNGYMARIENVPLRLPHGTVCY